MTLFVSFRPHGIVAKPIRKAVFPAAGLGTRFLPATKAMPKEMPPVVDRLLIQHVVDEARQHGIEHFIFVTEMQQGRYRGPFRPAVRAGNDLLERQKHTALEFLNKNCPRPVRRASRGSRSRWAWPRCVVRVSWSATSALRIASAGRAGSARARPPGADDDARGLSISASCRRGRGSAGRPRRSVWRGRCRRAYRQDVLDHQHAGEAAARSGAVQPHPDRPLHPPAGNPRHSRKP